VRVLVVGATGFLGGCIAAHLAAAGHVVVRGQRNALGRRDAVAVDLAREHRVEDWLPRLCEIDAVVNAVGILRESRGQTFDAIHARGPAALFRGCARAGVGKVIQISALGAEPGAASAYHRSKAAADAALAALPLAAVIVQPSLVFGAGGASATLLCGLASLPLVPLPGAGDQRIQPIHADDLARAVVRLLESGEWDGARIAAVGPEPLSLRAALASLRSQLGLPRTGCVRVPMAFVRAAAQLGRLRRDALLDPDTLGMLVRGNVAPPADIAAVLGAPPRPLRAFVAAHERRALATAGRLWWLLPLLRGAVAALWVASGVLSFGVFPMAESHALLARIGLHGTAASLALYGAAALDVAFGVAVYAVRRRRWLWRLQIAVILAYSAIVAAWLPEFWLHPFAPMVKNLPLLAALVLLHELDDGR
jgi:uncharacterized protein YbjT (DUF2867 family)